MLADYAIERTLGQGAHLIYTAPVKALSNQKYRDFTARYGEQVGIMTGDVTINPGAPLLIMTTEIYRNTLLEASQRLLRYAWIIFDEIHYLDDPERGTVWEEAILFTPPSINLLCLSATIPNVQEIARWIREVHERPVEVIEERTRVVPLHVLFQCQNTVVDTIQHLKTVGYRELERTGAPQHLRRPGRWRAAERRHRAHLGMRPNRFDHLIKEIQRAERLPCIFFTFGRRRAEELAWEAIGIPLLSGAERAELRALFDGLCGRFQMTRDRSVLALQHLIDHGIAYHHAGMLPTVKEIIERCFTSRLLKLIITTETFALGINMPARSVVLDALKKRSDQGFTVLRRRDFLQMAGRAGRRGMDEAGYVYLRVNPVHIRLQELTQLLEGEPEPVRSRFNTAYATLLNLYRRHGHGLLDVFPKTLYYFQTSGARRQEGLSLMQRKLDLLSTMGYLIPAGLTPKGEFGSWLYGYELLVTELYALGRLTPLDLIQLAVLMAAIVYEPRPRAEPPKRHRLSRHLEELCEGPLGHIHRQEAHWRIFPRTKPPCFALSHAMEAWMHGATFAKLSKLTDVDEGEIVRYFRMTVQLLRQLTEAPGADARLRTTAGKAFSRINRDVVDAEAQLRAG